MAQAPRDGRKSETLTAVTARASKGKELHKRLYHNEEADHMSTEEQVARYLTERAIQRGE